MFNKRNLSKEELAAQHDILLKQLAAVGLKPEDVSLAMQELQRQIETDLKKAKANRKNILLAVS